MCSRHDDDKGGEVMGEEDSKEGGKIESIRRFFFFFLKWNIKRQRNDRQTERETPRNRKHCK